MAYINGKETFFSPLQIGGNDVKLQGVKTVQIKENGTVNINADSGYDGMVKVVANINVQAESGGSSVGEWQAETVYNPNDIVIYNGIYYICIKTTQASNVLSNPENTPTEWERLNGSYKGEYDETASYSIGDIVEENGNIYQANIDEPQTPPYNDMANHWTKLYEGEGGSNIETQTKEIIITENTITEVMADEGKALSKVTITTAVESSGGDLPQLYAPTLSLNGDALVITENASNGSFAKSYDLYIDGSLVGNYTSTTIDLTTLELEDGKYSITVRAKGTNFAESADSVAIEYGVGLYLAGTYDASGTMLKSWEQLKTEFPEAFETEGVLGTKLYNNGYATSPWSIFRSVFNNECDMVVISDEITTIGENAFSNSSPTKVRIPKTVTSIGNKVFYNSAITEINIPSSVTSIGDECFSQAQKLANVVLNEGLESIGARNFYLTANTNLVIPASVKTIGEQGLFTMQTVTFLGTPEEIATNAFGTNLKTLNVPWAEGAVANAPWGATSATINYNYVAEG